MRIMHEMTIFAVLALVSGCAALEPNSVRVYAEHVSHVTQHFGSDPTNYGYDQVAAEVHYQRGGMYLNISEGINVDPQLKANIIGPVYGGLAGPRETFQAQAGYEFQLK